MFLTGPEILRQRTLGNLAITPFDHSHLGPNSYDVTLAPLLKVYTGECLDSRKQNPTEDLAILSDGLVLFPGILYLGSTVERTESDVYLPLLDGRSSAGRLGIQIHCTAGIGDVGFCGTWTLEILVAHLVRVYPGMLIGQIRFAEVVGEIELYRGRYQNQSGATASRMHRSKPEPSGLAKQIAEEIERHGEIDDGWQSPGSSPSLEEE